MTPEERVSLREYTDAMIERLRSEMLMQVKASERAVSLARDEIDRRLDEMNRFREQLEVERRGYITVARYEEKHTDLERRIARVEGLQANMAGRMVGLAVLGTVFVAVVVAIVTHLLGG